MKDNLPPEAPKPPSCRLQCGCCGYTAPEDEYNHTCYLGLTVSLALCVIPITLLVMIFIEVLNIYGGG